MFRVSGCRIPEITGYLYADQPPAAAGAYGDLGDVHAGIDDAVWDIEPLLVRAARDESDRGLGDARYPPGFPNLEGEPPRVQPSRMNRANWGGASVPDGVEPQEL